MRAHNVFVYSTIQQLVIFDHSKSFPILFYATYLLSNVKGCEDIYDFANEWIFEHGIYCCFKEDIKKGRLMDICLFVLPLCGFVSTNCNLGRMKHLPLVSTDSSGILSAYFILFSERMVNNAIIFTI